MHVDPFQGIYSQLYGACPTFHWMYLPRQRLTCSMLLFSSPLWCGTAGLFWVYIPRTHSLFPRLTNFYNFKGIKATTFLHCMFPSCITSSHLRLRLDGRRYWPDQTVLWACSKKSSVVCSGLQCQLSSVHIMHMYSLLTKATYSRSMLTAAAVVVVALTVHLFTYVSEIDVGISPPLILFCTESTILSYCRTIAIIPFIFGAVSSASTPSCHISCHPSMWHALGLGICVLVRKELLSEPYYTCSFSVGAKQTLLQTLALPIFAVPSLLLTPLLEPRYFLIPYILLRSQVDDMPEWAVWVEAAWYSLINWGTMYVFLYMEREGVGRFMW